MFKYTLNTLSLNFGNTLYESILFAYNCIFCALAKTGDILEDGQQKGKERTTQAKDKHFVCSHSECEDSLGFLLLKARARSCIMSVNLYIIQLLVHTHM